jgi:hypothetical protein
MAARFLRLVAPAILRKGMAQHEPVPADVVAKARARAAKGKRLGDLSD